MYLQNLSLQHFKNYSKAEFNFSKHLNFLTGMNGSGKTNALDAIHYLCLGKSYFHYSDQNTLQHETNFFRLEGKFMDDLPHSGILDEDKLSFQENGKVNQAAPEELRITCAFQAGNRKELSKNGIFYQRIVDHVGLIPVVMVTPDDQLLIDEGSEERRRFIDNTLSQIDHSYLEILLAYNKILQQRNAALKQFAFKGTPDRPLIESFDVQLTAAGQKIFTARRSYLLKMIPMMGKFYELLSGGREEISATYESVCRKEDLLTALHKSFEKDCVTQRTNTGIHRDDIDFFFNGRSLKKFGSQGQKKCFLMALKFAQYELIREEKNKTPLLLLDDLFDKLDEGRSKNILKLVSENGFGQVFITDTNDARVRNFIGKTKKESRHFTVDRGIVSNA
ncbi:MAG: DNA replication and repair protein RecF [Chitinophagales bacterium]